MPSILILGSSGKFGAHCASVFGAAGWTVARYRRGTDMTAAARGADVILNGLNPPDYHAWDRLVPEITEQVIAAAKACGATVILPGNVYNFGSDGGVWDERTPQRPCSRKGRVRVAMERRYRESGVRTIVLRAGNFIDPDSGTDVMALLLLRQIRRGRLTAPGDPDAMQAYAYVPDVARAALALAEIRETLPIFADIPFPGHAFSLRELQADLESALGRRVRIAGFPWWAMRLGAPVWELARELLEMRYLWSVSHRLSGETFGRLVPGFVATDIATVMRAGLPPDIRPDEAVGSRGLGLRV
ncbi:epimerase [Histidinibacterium lentulum]|uniref:Epimerase n=1 Tax=Histidinibacterium lentulum TaxID=2480588 RepID=A0A3N2R5M0_9RHOB|nr:epimerase [Histidinibacterium lentulum]